tara:strand:- start:2082 stop:2306 length:225 start_codon:yes stop_codon:yes gene_type:complete
MSLTDWESRDRIMCRFYAAEREVEGHGGNHQEIPGDVQPEKPVSSDKAETSETDGSTADPAPRRGARRKTAPEN